MNKKRAKVIPKHTEIRGVCFVLLNKIVIDIMSHFVLEEQSKIIKFPSLKHIIINKIRIYLDKANIKTSLETLRKFKTNTAILDYA